ncbi:MAG: 50S ribosomal protein L18 [Campylobacteraceae bacterium 4484_166]|nr:MAG: 50S ribosomal protein L18 [Campylobacteraceae bacterium 4484_166]
MSRAKDIKKKIALKIKRKKRVRGSIGQGTVDKPRVSIYKSNRYIFAQAIDDVTGNTMASIHSKTLNMNPTKENAVKIAEAFAIKLNESKITQIVFDRNGYLYHGVVKAFADTLRENGIKV